MKAVGGYFELTLPEGKEHFHREAIALNTGRNAFEYALRTRPGVRRVLLPHYICDTILEPVRRLGLVWDWYSLGEDLLPVGDLQVSDADVFLYVNYFGLADGNVRRLAEIYGTRLIVDGTQAFFAPPLPGIDTFYSARKFFGVPDGAYLYSDRVLDGHLEQDQSWDRFEHLVKRWELGPEGGYDDFKRADARLNDREMKAMSAITDRLLRCVPYEAAAQRRIANYQLLHSRLGEWNRWRELLPAEPECAPMTYPLLIRDGGDLKRFLISRRVFVPTYWESVLERLPPSDSIERLLVRDLVCLPLDQRYSADDMPHIVEQVLAWRSGKR